MRKADIKYTMERPGKAAKSAAYELACAAAERKYTALITASEAVITQTKAIAAASERDMAQARAKGLSAVPAGRCIGMIWFCEGV